MRDHWKRREGITKIRDIGGHWRDMRKEGRGRTEDEKGE